MNEDYDLELYDIDSIERYNFEEEIRNDKLYFIESAALMIEADDSIREKEQILDLLSKAAKIA